MWWQAPTRSRFIRRATPSTRPPSCGLTRATTSPSSTCPASTRPPYEFSDRPASSGADAIVLGYPEDGPFTVTPVRVRNTVNLVGPDIYADPKDVTREVYTVRGNIRSGNSGGPMIAPDGTVLGVVFGASENPVDETGFVLTAKQVDGDLTGSAKRPATAEADVVVPRALVARSRPAFR